ncbi:MAG: hypothetical protein PVG22_00865 [Chromatiales bacterium]|jgi:hypothetical protein
MRIESILLGVCLFLVGCSVDPENGPREVKWDRDTCERCRMVLSDRNFAAQIRYFPDHSARSKVVMFDDIGCAILWLDEKPWKDDPRSEIWVVDHRTGTWIDARRATYLTGVLTPMEYGLAAQLSPAAGGLTFAQAKQQVVEIERRFSEHGLHLIYKFKEQARQREAEHKAREEEQQLPPIIPD